MKDTNYAYCVARLSANESYMLSSEKLLRLIDAESLSDGINELISYGYIDEADSIENIVNHKLRSLWNLLEESVPDKKELEVLCVLNDFFNIKAAVKCYFSHLDAADYYIYPTSIDTKRLSESLLSQSFSLERDIFSQALERAYNSACITENGQRAELISDRAAVDCLREYAFSKKNSPLVRRVCELLCDTANIKTAFRIALTGKDKAFASEAIGECCNLDRSALIDCCTNGVEPLCDYLKGTGFSSASELYCQSAALYDKWCDENLLRLVSQWGYTSFGFEPVCKFYYKKVNEIKNIRIILTSLASDINKDEIKERVRL